MMERTKSLTLPFSFALSALVLFAYAPGCGGDVASTQSTNVSSSPSSSSAGGGGTQSTSTASGGGIGGSGGTSTASSNGGGGSGGTGAGGTMMDMVPADCDVVIQDSGSNNCGGETYSLELPPNASQYKVCLLGNTIGSTSEYSGADCGAPSNSDGNEKVYVVDYKTAGSHIVKLRSFNNSTLNPTLYARQNMQCDNGQISGAYGCWFFFDSHEEFAFDSPPDTYHLFVDGANGSSGEYLLELIVKPASCGDGVINPSTGEQCDDGNQSNNDGCTSMCKLESIALFDSCNGEPVVLLPGQQQSQILQGNTTGYTDNYTATDTAGCTGTIPTGGKDRVYEVVAGANGKLTASIGFGLNGTENICDSKGLIDPGCWNYVLYVVGPDACETGGQLANQLACSDSAVFGPEQVTFDVEAGKKYYVIIDGYADYEYGYGSFNLQLSLN